MSGYGFNDYEDNPQSAEPGPDQGPAWFRSYMDKVSGQLKELQAENAALRQEKTRGTVEDTLKAKGYNPSAATLYTGEPSGLDDWLSTHGDALAKLPTASGEEPAEPAPSGPPPTTVPAERQDQMRLMQEAGTSGIAAPQGAEAELVNALRNASPEEFAKLMKANGSAHDWSGLH
jgi:hypothetical protein